MQVDFQVFRTTMEQFTGLRYAVMVLCFIQVNYCHKRPLPHHAFVEDYIRAYYVTDEEAEKWLKNHTVG